MRAIRYHPIGIIHSPLKTPIGAPLQSVSAKDLEGTIDIFPEYASGLKDIEGFSHLILIYHFHLASEVSLTVKPYLDNKTHGIFATRAPARPNPIGISTVKLREVKGGWIRVRGIDVVDGTPLLDIKPYVPKFDTRRVQRIGWYDQNLDRLHETRADGRFARKIAFG